MTAVASQPRPWTQAYGIVVFGTWMIVGLFLDGWAHIHDKPESFFSPWHAVLYSGFAAGAASIAIDRRRRRSAAEPVVSDRLVLAGMGVFALGGLGDGVWHQVFGVEVDLDALLSPSHLLLMTGGLLMLTSPLRQRPLPLGGWRGFLPVAVSATLLAALCSFFLMYASAFHGYPAGGGDLGSAHTVASVLLTNGLLFGPLLYILRAGRPPFGTATLIFTGVAVLMTGLEGFDAAALIVPAAVGGLSADLLIRHVRRRHVLAVVSPAVLWSGWFVAQTALYGAGWAAELIGGTIVLAALEALALSLLVFASPQELGDAPGGDIRDGRLAAEQQHLAH